MEILTKNEHNFYSVSSMMQKAIRRGDRRSAVLAANEITENFPMYVSNRAPVILCEDCYGLLGVKIEPLIMENKKLDTARKKANGDELTQILSKIKLNNIKIIELLARGKYNRDLQYLKSYHVFQTLSEFANDKDLSFEDFVKDCESKFILAVKEKDLNSVLGLLTVIYFYNQANESNIDKGDLKDATLNLIKTGSEVATVLLDYIELLEIESLISLFNHKYMKTTKGDRNLIGKDDSYYMIMRIAFVICGLYEESYTEELLEDSVAELYLKMDLPKNYKIPDYAVVDLHNGAIGKVEFTMREYDEATNIAKCLFTEAEIKDIIILEEVDYFD